MAENSAHPRPPEERKWVFWDDFLFGAFIYLAFTFLPGRYALGVTVFAVVWTFIGTKRARRRLWNLYQAGWDGTKFRRKRSARERSWSPTETP